jgi:hypothetical protein
VRRCTPKRAREEREYLKRRKEFLAEHRLCTVAMSESHWLAATEVHHRRGRVGTLLLDERYWLAVCHDCHGWIHNHPALAYEYGWMELRTAIQCSRSSWSDRCTFTDGHEGLYSFEPETVLDGP